MEWNDTILGNEVNDCLIGYALDTSDPRDPDTIEIDERHAAFYRVSFALKSAIWDIIAWSIEAEIPLSAADVYALSRAVGYIVRVDEYGNREVAIYYDSKEFDDAWYGRRIWQAERLRDIAWEEVRAQAREFAVDQDGIPLMTRCLDDYHELRLQLEDLLASR